MYTFSSRCDSLTASASLALAAKVGQLKAAGKSVVSLSVGELPWDTPANIQEAAIRAMQSGKTRYTPVAGIPELRQAIATKLETENGVRVEPAQVLVTAGAKQALFDLCMVLLNPGDEVLVPDPAWLSYEPMVAVAGGKFVRVPSGTDFRCSAEQLETALTKRSKAVILNSPNNPTGVVLTRPEWEEIIEFVRAHDLWLISDEVYEYCVYGGRKHLSPASLSTYDKIVTVNAFSKSFAMTGWRIGYCAGPTELITKMSDLLSHSTSNTSSIAQYAALAGLQESKPYLVEWQETLEKNKTATIAALQQTKAQVLEPEGGLYAFVNVSAFLNDSSPTSLELSEYLLENHGIAVVPGEAFSEQGKEYVRVSFALYPEELHEGLERLTTGLSTLFTH